MQPNLKYQSDTHMLYLYALKLFGCVAELCPKIVLHTFSIYASVANYTCKKWRVSFFKGSVINNIPNRIYFTYTAFLNTQAVMVPERRRGMAQSPLKDLIGLIFLSVFDTATASKFTECYCLPAHTEGSKTSKNHKPTT